MSVGQLRSVMSYTEYRSWKAYYLLEPWGWHDREVRTATTMALMHNLKVKRSQRLKPDDFITNRPKMVLDAYREQDAQIDMRNKLLEADIEERRRMIGQAWGAMGKKTKIGGAS